MLTDDGRPWSVILFYICASTVYAEQKIQLQYECKTCISCSGAGFRLTWLLHSRYLRVSKILIRTCFFLPPPPLVVAVGSTPTRYANVRATAEGAGPHFCCRLWNIGISSRLPPLQLLLSNLSIWGWREFWESRFPSSHWLGTHLPNTLTPALPARHQLIVPTSTWYQNPCFVYAVSSIPLWPTFKCLPIRFYATLVMKSVFHHRFSNILVINHS